MKTFIFVFCLTLGAFAQTPIHLQGHSRAVIVSSCHAPQSDLVKEADMMLTVEVVRTCGLVYHNDPSEGMRQLSSTKFTTECHPQPHTTKHELRITASAQFECLD